MKRIKENMELAIVGKEEAIKLSIITLFAKGHLLIEDIPGVGKTTLAKSLAKSVDLSFSRIQFTPDLLPSDVVGVSIFNQKTNEFMFKHGPVHANVILADEINRASPKTQSSLLESMAERQCTVDGVTYTLEEPFMVIATQNPIEFEGTFPLPEAQLDRFMMRIALGYPSKDMELKLLGEKVDSMDLSAVVSREDVLGIRREVEKIDVKQSVKRFIIDLAHSARENKEVFLAPSPRAVIDLYEASKAYAYMQGRTYVVPEDIKYLAPYVWSHRVVLSPEQRFAGVTSIAYVKNLVKDLPFTMEEDHEK